MKAFRKRIIDIKDPDAEIITHESYKQKGVTPILFDTKPQSLISL